MRGFLSDERLAELKEIYRLKLEKAFNTEIRMVVVHHAFAEGFHTVRRQVAYDFREPMEHVAKYLDSGGSYTPRGVEFGRRIILDRRKNAKHVVYFGWMHEKRVKSFMRHLDVEYENLKDWRKKRRELNRHCPLHPLTELVELEGRYTLSQLEDEVFFIGYTGEIPEMLSVDVSG